MSAKKHPIMLRPSEKLHAEMKREAARLNMPLTQYLIHCHTMWKRMEDGKAKE